MNERARKRLTESVEMLTGETCSDAVVVQQRKGGAMAIAVALALAALIIGGVLDFPDLLRGALLGAAVGTGLTIATTYWVIARVGNDVVTAKATKMQPRAVAIDVRRPAPAMLADTGGWLIRKVTVGGVEYLVPKRALDRLRAIVR